jgi:hypothetical protein
LGESKYIVVPKGTNYTVNLKGEGEEGSYTLMFDAVVGDGTPQNIRTFTLATVTPSMNATLTKEGTTYSPLRSDYNNDGTIDETKPFYEEPVVTKALLYGQLRIQIQNLTKLPLREKNSLLKVVDKAAVVGSCVTKTCRVAERVLLEGVRITVHAYTKKNLITTQEFGILVTTIDAIIKKI